MHYLTPNPKVKPTHLELHLQNLAQELVRKNKSLLMIESYLGEVLREWKETRVKYHNAGTSIRQGVAIASGIEVKNGSGEIVFTIK